MKKTVFLLTLLGFVAADMIAAAPADAQTRMTRSHLQRYCTDPDVLAQRGLTRAYGLVADFTNSRYGPDLRCHAFNRGRRVWYQPDLGEMCLYFTDSRRFVRNARRGFVCLGR